MSNESMKPPYEVVLKGGVYQSKNTKGGLNMRTWLLKLLKRIGFAETADPLCCQYFPTVPVIEVADFSNPSEDEMDAAKVPVYGMFRTVSDVGVIFVWMRGQSGDGAFTLGTND